MHEMTRDVPMEDQANRVADRVDRQMMDRQAVDRTDSSRDDRRRRRRGGGRAVLVVLALLLTNAATAAAFLFGLVPGLGTGETAGSAAAALPPATAEVTRQTLVDTYAADGELGYGPATTLTNRLPGTLTYVPDTGTRIGRGEVLYEVDDTPVALLYGETPAYRPLRPGAEGRDVKQLEQNLRALGYTGFTVDREYTSETADAVEAWQEDLGLTETGAVELGRVVFAPAAVRVDSVALAEGGPLQPGQSVLSYTGTEKAVTVELETSEQRLAEEGAPVTVTFPDDVTVDGRIEDVATVIQPAEGQDQEPATIVEVLVEITDQAAAEPYALAAVDVEFTADERPDVLTVPVGALLALSEGGFGVEVVKGRSTSYVPVETGLFANGMVEISGDGIAEGTTVGVPE